MLRRVRRIPAPVRAHDRQQSRGVAHHPSRDAFSVLVDGAAVIGGASAVFYEATVDGDRWKATAATAATSFWLTDDKTILNSHNLVSGGPRPPRSVHIAEAFTIQAFSSSANRCQHDVDTFRGHCVSMKIHAARWARGVGGRRKNVKPCPRTASSTKHARQKCEVAQPLLEPNRTRTRYVFYRHDFFMGPSNATAATTYKADSRRVRGASKFGMFGIRLFSVPLSCCTGAQRTFRETCAGSSRRERRSAPRTKLRSSISGSRARILRACHGLLALTCLMRLLRIALPNNFLAWRSHRTSGVAA